MIIEYTVSSGENIGDIAKKFNIDVSDIERVNTIDLMSLKDGQVIKIPVRATDRFEYYQVKKGDTLYGIATKYDIDSELLAEINGIKVYDYLYPNQILLVPLPGVKFYVTKLGDTLESVAIKEGTTPEIFIKDNLNIYLLPEQLLSYRQ